MQLLERKGERIKAHAAPQACGEAIERFEQAFFADPRRRRSKPGSRTTWTGAYLPYLRRLQARANDSPIDADLLQDTLASYEDGSRSR